MKTRLRYVVKQSALILLVLVLAAIIFALGLAFGYGGLGNGENPWSILSPDTWKEILSKFTGQ
ncbi:DNA-directed RNA polymerase subunit beta [Streptococcus massiliensis]|nr:DNA-directed RNA polymerase subunit beta [Streptococcus massiliensis]